jgi:hypothetical protein
MDDAAVVCARLHPRARTTLQDGNGTAGGRELSRHRQAGHAGTDYEDVERQGPSIIRLPALLAPPIQLRTSLYTTFA